MVLPAYGCFTAHVTSGVLASPSGGESTNSELSSPHLRRKSSTSGAANGNKARSFTFGIIWRDSCAASRAAVGNASRERLRAGGESAHAATSRRSPPIGESESRDADRVAFGIGVRTSSWALRPAWGWQPRRRDHHLASSNPRTSYPALARRRSGTIP